VKLRSFWKIAPSWARYDIWNVGIAALDRPLADVRDLARWTSIRWLPPRPPFRFVADPFPYRDADGREWLLVEDYGHQRRERGRISRVDPANPSSPLEPVIARDRHMSYPFTFTDAGGTYCTPEISAEDGVAVYRLHDGAWTLAHHILRGQRLVDPTVVRYDGLWWVFGTDPKPSHNAVLRAFYSKALAGPWTAHTGNPLKNDPASARPAGRPFTIGDRLFRPAQDCRLTYGGAVNVMEVRALTPTEFDESPALRLEPDPSWPYPDGLHHLVVEGTRVYFDAKRAHVDFLLWAKLF
jgi:hypothetical protein